MHGDVANCPGFEETAGAPATCVVCDMPIETHAGQAQPRGSSVLRRADTTRAGAVSTPAVTADHKAAAISAIMAALDDLAPPTAGPGAKVASLPLARSRTRGRHGNAHTDSCRL